MSHDNHQYNGKNNDLEGKYRTLADYLSLTKGWQDPMDPPIVQLWAWNHGYTNYHICDSNVSDIRQAMIQSQDHRNVHDAPYDRFLFVVREDLHRVGTKARFGDFLMQNIEKETVVYVQPRCGFAGISLSSLTKKYGKRLVLFCPASKEVSVHQRVCAELGAELKFYRVAAMPNLNKVAAEWAQANGAEFVPLGLRHPLVTAAGVRVAYDLAFRIGGQPPCAWSVLSTGVLTRALQIAWPDTVFQGVAVARNMKYGELGRIDKPLSHPQPFLDDAKVQPPFDSASNYDAKAWEFIIKPQQLGGAPNYALFWNVAGNIQPTTTQKTFPINSAREWGERDF